MSVHIIYIMVNDKVPNLVKIGKTTTSVEQRSKELSRDTGVPGKWMPLKWWLVPDCHIAERHVHKELSAKRLQKNKEFFKFNGAEAVQEVHYCLARLGVVDWAGLKDYIKLKEEEARIAEEREKAKAEEARKRKEEQRKANEKIQKEKEELWSIERELNGLERLHYSTSLQDTLKETIIWVFKDFLFPLFLVVGFFAFIMEVFPAPMLVIFCISSLIGSLFILNVIIKKGFKWDKQKELSDIAEQIKIVEAYLNQKTKEFNHST